MVIGTRFLMLQMIHLGWGMVDFTYRYVAGIIFLRPFSNLQL